MEIAIPYASAPQSQLPSDGSYDSPDSFSTISTSAAVVLDHLDTLNNHDSPPLLQPQPWNQTYSKPWLLRGQLLVASPYSEPQHLLELQSLDAQSRLLALALTALAPATENYAISDYD